MGEKTMTADEIRALLPDIGVGEAEYLSAVVAAGEARRERDALRAKAADLDARLCALADNYVEERREAARYKARAERDLGEVANRLQAAHEERDRLARILAVERGDESQAPEGWAMTDSGSWRARSQTYRIVCRTHAIGERGQPLRAWEAWVAGKRVGVYPFALEAIDAANSAD